MTADEITAYKNYLHRLTDRGLTEERNTILDHCRHGYARPELLAMVDYEGRRRDCHTVRT